MSWIERCYEVYENNTAFIGDMHTGKVPLVPFAHTIQDVHVIVRINAEGKFKGASVLGKGEVRTIIPCTEKSLARTSGVVPHPLFLEWKGWLGYGPAMTFMRKRIFL